MQYCPNFQMVLVAKTPQKIFVSRTRCKMWTCEYCASTNRSQWQARLIDHIENSDNDWSWFTLTAHSKKRTSKASLENMRGSWDTLIKRAKRRYGKFAYCRVYEKHKSGAYHLHCIRSGHFGDIKTRTQRDGKKVLYSAWLSDTAKSLKLGYYTHASDLDRNDHGGYIASYVVKYLAKLSVETKSELGRVRHIQCSQNWPKLTEKSPELDWSLETGFYELDFWDAVEAKQHVVDIQTGERLTSDNFLDTYIYPRSLDHRHGTV